MKIFVCEFLGTAFLTMMVFGSGIMGESLAQGNVALALLANSLATSAGLFVLIKTLGSISGAHLNPLVSFVELIWGRLTRKDFFKYLSAQFLGAFTGMILTHVMFNQAILQLSTQHRFGLNLWISEIVAAFGLICTISLSGRKHVEFAPMAISLYIFSAYWFTSSTSFVNPAITFARAFTDTFCGMNYQGVVPYFIAQFIGALFAVFTLNQLDSNK